MLCLKFVFTNSTNVEFFCLVSTFACLIKSLRDVDCPVNGIFGGTLPQVAKEYLHDYSNEEICVDVGMCVQKQVRVQATKIDYRL